VKSLLRVIAVALAVGATVQLLFNQRTQVRQDSGPLLLADSSGGP